MDIQYTYHSICIPWYQHYCCECTVWREEPDKWSNEYFQGRSDEAKQYLQLMVYSGISPLWTPWDYRCMSGLRGVHIYWYIFGRCGNAYLCCGAQRRRVLELSFAAHLQERLTRGYNYANQCCYNVQLLNQSAVPDKLAWEASERPYQIIIQWILYSPST